MAYSAVDMRQSLLHLLIPDSIQRISFSHQKTGRLDLHFARLVDLPHHPRICLEYLSNEKSAYTLSCLTLPIVRNRAFVQALSS